VRPERQRLILDAFGNALDIAAAVAAAHAQLKTAEAALMQFDAQRNDGAQRAELLRHQVDEIDKAALEPGEEEALELEARRLHHAEELAALSSRLHNLLYAAEGSITARLDDARRALAHLLRIDAAAVDAPGSLDEAYYVIEDLGRRLGDYAAGIEHDAARLDAIGRRQDLIFRLKTRCGPTVEDVIAAGRAARAELDRLDGTGFERTALAREVEQRRSAYREHCEQLSRKRARAAARLAKEVCAILPSLGMPGGRFEVCLESLEQPGAQGAETVEFRVSLNIGFEPRPVSRVSSGGELSRLMLALRAILARADSTPVLAFDEIDAGIGGRVAHAVADKLLAVSGTHQVFVITHLAQIAARAQHHLLVEKKSARGTASTNVRELSGEERIQEVARLLGGDPESQASLEHARELLSL
jgi:DNA repair protein RecN (Recombination protein N)